MFPHTAHTPPSAPPSRYLQSESIEGMLQLLSIPTAPSQELGAKYSNVYPASQPATQPASKPPIQFARQKNQQKKVKKKGQKAEQAHQDDESQEVQGNIFKYFTLGSREGAVGMLWWDDSAQGF